MCERCPHDTRSLADTRPARLHDLDRLLTLRSVRRLELRDHAADHRDGIIDRRLTRTLANSLAELVPEECVAARVVMRSSAAMSFELGGKSVEDLGGAHRVDVAGFTGAASLTIPISTPAGRSSLRPELALVYTSGRGNTFDPKA